MSEQQIKTMQTMTLARAIDLINEQERRIAELEAAHAAWLAARATPVSPAQPNGTPAAQWRVDGEPDPHGNRYDCERAALTLGDYTDDELANGAFLNYDQPLPIADMLHPKPGQHMPIVWMTAVKDRIRWLSRKLSESTAPVPAPATADSASPTVTDGMVDAYLAAQRASVEQQDLALRMYGTIDSKVACRAGLQAALAAAIAEFKGKTAPAHVAAAPVAGEGLTERVLEMWANYERMGEVCSFEGQPMIYASNLEELATLAKAERQPQPADSSMMELRARIKEMQEAAYTYGEYSKDAVSAVLDGVLDEIDAAIQQAGKEGA